MPCDSTITTKLTDPNRITEAMKAMGYDVDRVDDDRVIVGRAGNQRLTFTRGSAEGYRASGYTTDLPAVSKKYAEIGVRAWAKKRGYSILDNDGTKITLVNRRK